MQRRRPLIEDLERGRTGARYLELDWCVDMNQIRKKHGNTIGLIGNVNPTLFLTGTPEVVEDSCRKAVDQRD